MSLYPTLEDMKVDHMAQTQSQVSAQAYNDVSHIQSVTALPPAAAAGLYPSLGDYMGLDLAQALALQPVVHQNMQVATPQGNTATAVAPVTGAHNTGVARAEIKQGVRQVILCKDGEGKMGLRVRSVDKVSAN